MAVNAEQHATERSDDAATTAPAAEHPDRTPFAVDAPGYSDDAGSEPCDSDELGSGSECGSFETVDSDYRTPLTAPTSHPVLPTDEADVKGGSTVHVDSSIKEMPTVSVESDGETADRNSSDVLRRKGELESRADNSGDCRSAVGAAADPVDAKERLTQHLGEVAHATVDAGPSTHETVAEPVPADVDVGSVLPSASPILPSASAVEVDRAATPRITRTAGLQALQMRLDAEQSQLEHERAKGERDAIGVTTEMMADTQELLRLFGLPYVVAPMEAEAQCAELERLGLVEGVVTDDGDALLFGAQRVYRHMFNRKQHPQILNAADIEQHLGLTRERLILLAYVLGGDYADGVPGIGHVRAMEIVNEFSGASGAAGESEDALERFAAFMRAPGPPSDGESSVRRRLRSLLEAWQPGESFRDLRIRDAYLHPQVDSSTEPVEWHFPDIVALGEFCKSRIGWSAEQTATTIMPILRRMQQRQQQPSAAMQAMKAPLHAASSGVLHEPAPCRVRGRRKQHDVLDASSHRSIESSCSAVRGSGRCVKRSIRLDRSKRTMRARCEQEDHEVTES